MLKSTFLNGFFCFVYWSTVIEKIISWFPPCGYPVLRTNFRPSFIFCLGCSSMRSCTLSISIFCSALRPDRSILARLRICNSSGSLEWN